MSYEVNSAKQKRNFEKEIAMKEVLSCVVHDGTFHADDALGVAELDMYLELSGQRLLVHRTRKEDVIRASDYAIDVGGLYDHHARRYDHHQFKAGECVRANGVPYASSGLFHKHHGAEICGSEDVAELVDQLLIQSVDANDTGFTVSRGLIPGLEPYDIPQIIADMNPRVGEDYDQDAAFQHAVVLIKIILRRVILRAESLLPMRTAVREALGMCVEPEILVLPRNYGRDWEFTVCAEAPEVLFVVYPDKEDDWRIRAVPIAPGGFEHRRKLPESWAGKKPEDLVHLTGAETAKFCHNLRFIASAKTREDAIWMARMAAAPV